MRATEREPSCCCKDRQRRGTGRALYADSLPALGPSGRAARATLATRRDTRRALRSLFVIDELHEIAAVRLRHSGQRYTASRRAIVGVLAAAGRPLTIPEVLAKDDGLALSSAYRNLAVLEQAHVVDRIVTSDDHARYELAEDLTGHHHHLVCVECGAVEDFELPHGLEKELGGALRRTARKAGFDADHHRLDLVGRCKRCS